VNPPTKDAETTLDLTALASAGRDVLEASVNLPGPRTQLRVRLPAGQAGRAEASFGQHRWAAKHYWNEGDGVVVYEFDEALPAGPVVLRIPLDRTM
jgi:hypothetical protein